MKCFKKVLLTFQSPFCPSPRVRQEKVKPSQSLVDILRRKIESMIVIPERAQCLIDVAASARESIEARQNVRIPMVVEETGIEEVARESITLRRSVTIVKVGRGLRDPEPYMTRRQVVEPSDENWLAITSVKSRSRKGPIESPDRVQWQIPMEAVRCLTLMGFVELVRCKFTPSLVYGNSRLSGYRSRLRCGIQRCNRLCELRNRERLYERCSRGTDGSTASSTISAAPPGPLSKA